VKKNIFFNLLMLGFCATFISFSWAGDDAETA